MKKNKLKKERRQNIRFRVFSLVKHATEPDIVTFQVDNIQNISRGGLAFFTEEDLKEGAVLQLHFLPPNRAEPVEARGKVVRCPKITKKLKSFEIGVQFLDISEDGKLAIQELEIFALEKQKAIQSSGSLKRR